MMNLFRPIILVGLLFLGGCSGLAGLGGALMSAVGGGAVDAFQDKVEIRAEHRVEKKRLLTLRIDDMVTEARGLCKTDYPACQKIWDKVFEVHDKAMPKWLYQELRGDHEDK